MENPTGLLLVDKPAGWTSHDVVAKVRRLLNTRKVGHAGTLDPMATGLLVLGVGGATKLLTYLVGADKTYLATIRLGAATVTDDAESDYLHQARPTELELIDRPQIEAAIAKLRGTIEQIPSSVSAIKVAGRRAYDLVRAGQDVELKSRSVTISRFELINEPVRVGANQFLDLEVAVDCSSGTYIRALARDLGASLGVGGHLTALRRIRIGNFELSSGTAMTEQQFSGENARERLIPLAVSASGLFETTTLNASQITDLRHGKTLDSVSGSPDSTGLIAALSEAGDLVAILKVDGPKVRSQVIFNEASND